MGCRYCSPYSKAPYQRIELGYPAVWGFMPLSPPVSPPTEEAPLGTVEGAEKEKD